MIIAERNHHYILWENGKEYTVTTNKRVEVFKGTKEDCKNYMSQHPYGTKTR